MSNRFFKAIQSGDKEIVEKMIQKSPHLLHARDKNKLSPLMVALYHDQTELADLFHDRMVTLTVHEAASLGKMSQLIGSLARKPELVNAYSEDGSQPLGLAAHFGRKEVAEYLLKAGAEVNSKSRNGFELTALQSAVAMGHLEITQLLLDVGASPNVQDQAGLTPLHVAAQKGDVIITHSLLFGGANLEAVTKENKTALDLANEAGHEDVIELLKAGITRRFRGTRMHK